MEKTALSRLKQKLDPKRNADKAWYLALLDEDIQRACEEERLADTLSMLKLFYLSRHKARIAQLKAEVAALKEKEDYSAEDYRAVLEKNAEIAAETARLNAYKRFFTEPYFARMDVVDEKEGYNAYYIGKKGDVNLEIVDWRAPLAVRYYQKSRVRFSINEYDYRAVLRRALSVKNGKFSDFKNEYLSVKDVLTPEEIGGRDEEILFDPYLRKIVKSRRDDARVRDIIETIQERQFAVIARPERESFVLQGCAGSGKTMILLHRLSYLMYNNESLRPRDVLVITPSDSFNAFIDELAQTLELQRVRTITLKNYYFRVLEKEGISLAAKLSGEREDPAYLAYLYSERFPADAEKRINKLYSDLYGLFAAPECREVAEKLLADCETRARLYGKIKNASVRVRRAVLGEMKERKDGGCYFTKAFRTLMSSFVQAEDFLRFALGGKTGSADRFFRLFVEFFRCSSFVVARSEEVFAQADGDLAALLAAVEKEIADLRRYRLRRGDGEVFTYADRIARREELREEIAKTREVVLALNGGSELFREFFSVVRRAKGAAELGKCKDGVDISRWLYRETIKKYKAKFGMKGIYPSDGYALCYVLAAAGRKLSPRYGYVFVDEGQDLAAGEYRLLRRIHADAAFDVFGDLKQNVTPWRGIGSWDALGYPVYELDRNYRNTNEIVDFVTAQIDVEMRPIGLGGAPVARIRARSLNAFFRGKQGLKAVIAREEYLPLFARRGYRLLGDSGALAEGKVNVMSVYESKGLEFSAVAVYDKGMTDNEKYIAYTRALRELAVVED